MSNVCPLSVGGGAGTQRPATPCLTTPPGCRGSKVPIPLLLTRRRPTQSAFCHSTLWTCGFGCCCCCCFPSPFPRYERDGRLMFDPFCRRSARVNPRPGPDVTCPGTAAGLSVPPPDATHTTHKHTHTHPNPQPEPPAPSDTTQPLPARPPASGQLLRLRRIKDELFFFFSPFLSMPDERPPRHPLHAHTIQARTHRKSMC